MNTTLDPYARLMADIRRMVRVELAAKRVDAYWYGDGTEQELHDALTELHKLVAPPGAIPIVVDPSMPDDTVHIVQEGKVAGKITNLKP